MAVAWTFIHILFAISFSFWKAVSYPVPLLIWSSKSVDVDDEILAGHTLNFEDVQEKYIDKLKTQSKTICLFVQDKLSIDDFAVNPGEHMKHLKEILRSSPTSIVLPSVSLKQDFEDDGKGNKLVEYLEKNSKGAIIPLTAQDVTDFPNRIKSLPTDVPTVIIVHLPQAKTGEDSMRNLEPSDEIIGKMSDLLSSHFPDYVALLTASMPRDDVRSGMADARQVSISHTRERRSTVDDERSIPCNQTGVLVAKEDTMVYITNIFLQGNDNNTDRFNNRTNTIIPKENIILDNTTESEGSGLNLTFHLNNEVFENGSDITISMVFNMSGLRWWCESIEMHGKIKNSSINDTNYECREKIDVPRYKSYACQVSLKFSNNSQLVFEGLQLQPYNVTNSTFANSYDCIGFFTPPIWMGLISVGILVAILYGGMLALLSIKSMDRFDNPKDPPLVIHSE